MPAGKRVLVTGAASGIGLVIARAFAGAGARVFGLDRKPEVGSLMLEHEGLIGIPCDLTRPAELAKSLIEILAAGDIDILINNAAINPSPTSLEATVEETWSQILEANLSSVYRVSKAVIPHMRSGVILNIGSILGMVGARKNAAYAATKGAILSLTRSMALDLAPRIRVNCICPGAIETEMLEGYLRRYPDPESERRRIIQDIPLGRLGTPEDVASAALFLASDGASWITGASLVVDGGDSA